MKQQQGIIYKGKKALRMCCLVLCLSFGLFSASSLIAPKQAQALDCPGWGYLYFCTDLKEIANEVATMLQFISFHASATAAAVANALSWEAQGVVMAEEMFFLIEEFKNTAVGTIAAQQLSKKIEMNIAKANNDNRVKTALASALMKDQSTRSMGVPGSNYLCNVININLATPSLAIFKNILSEKLQRGYSNSYRSAGADGNGPQAIAHARSIALGEYDYPSTCNPIESDDCVVSAADRVFIDASMLAETLDLNRAYTMPKATNDNDAQEVAPLEDESEKMWMAAWQYCYNALGFRPSMLRGKNIDTPQGLRQRTEFGICSSRQSAFAKGCFDRLAWITRPNCEDSTFEAACETGKLACEAAEAAGVTLPSSYDCEKGLSYYQSREISVFLCKADSHVFEATKAGATASELSRYGLSCNMHEAIWTKSKVIQESTFSAAMLGMIDASECMARIR